MAKCSIHKEKDAIARCSICGKPFCEICLEKVGEKYMCFDCLEKIAKKQAKRSRFTYYKALNIPLLISIASYTLIALYILFLSLPLVPETLGDLTSFEARDFMVLIGKVVLLVIEVSLIYVSASFSFMFGMLLSLGLIASIFLGAPTIELTNEILIFYIVLPLIGLIGLIAGRKSLK